MIFDPFFISLKVDKWRTSAFQVLGAHARVRCSLSRVSIAHKNFTTPPIVRVPCNCVSPRSFLEISTIIGKWKRTLNLIYMKHRVPILLYKKIPLPIFVDGSITAFFKTKKIKGNLKRIFIDSDFDFNIR